MTHAQRLARFTDEVLPNLDSAYNLARWMTGDVAASRDAVQDACLRAFRAFDEMHGPNTRGWFLAIVRNACLDELRARRARASDVEYDDDLHGVAAADDAVATLTPEEIAERCSDARWLRGCIETLPREYREVIVLRELEELSYKEISAIVDIPIGTVMSRLARGRDLLQRRMLQSVRRSRP